MSKEKPATLIRLPIKTSSAGSAKPSEYNSDEFSPMRAARLFAEASKLLGPEKSVAQIYEEIMTFNADAYLKSLKESRA